MSTKSNRVYSSSGCLRCKQRHKKCDEVHPVCNNCRRNKLSCLWHGGDKAAKSYLRVNTALSRIDAVVRFRDETCVYAYQLPPLSPLNSSLSSGHPSVRNGTEDMLLTKLAGFLTMLSPSKKLLVAESNAHVFSVGIEKLWVRDALVAFAAFAFSARNSSLRSVSYMAYQRSIGQVQQQVRRLDWFESKDGLLVASLFLGMIEVNNPENTVFPLLHFEAVGRLIGMIQWKKASNSMRAFYRIATESYIYHVAILAMFYPQTNRYAKLSPSVEEMVCKGATGPNINIIISLDIVIYSILFELTTLSRADRSEANFPGRLEAVQKMLDEALNRAIIESTAATEHEGHFWSLTHAACVALQIFLAKIKIPTILATAEEIGEAVRLTTRLLRGVAITRTWTGNFVWILTILLCAATTPGDVEQVDAMIDQIKEGLWGGDLLRIQQIIRIVQEKRKQVDHFVASGDNVIVPEHFDTLSILLNRDGVLG